MDPKTLEIEVRSDVYEAPHHETGEPVEHLAFYVIATALDGRRFAHNYGFNTQALRRGEAERRSDALASKIVQAAKAGAWQGPEDSPYWHELDPAYGSIAWITEGIDAERAEREKADDLAGLA